MENEEGYQEENNCGCEKRSFPDYRIFEKKMEEKSSSSFSIFPRNLKLSMSLTSFKRPLSSNFAVSFSKSQENAFRFQ
jgi:hypothetical protein